MTKQSKKKSQSNTHERGVALIFCLFALLILTAVTASLIMITGTETSVNYNYRTEEIAFFAAKSGIYEALDRMQQGAPNSIASSIPALTTTATPGVLYIINAGSSLTVQPWNPSNAYFDDEFCHEGYSMAGMTPTSPDVPCTTVPTGSAWYTTASSPVASNSPWSGTSTAMPYEWVRINWKQNSTESYLSGGTTPVTSYYSVNSGGSSTTPACWNGASEALFSTGGSAGFTRCENYLTCGVAPNVTTPVLMITALAVTSNGSRQMVQAEAALNPPTVSTVPSTCSTSDAYGFFAYGQGYSCSMPSFQFGGNASVDGYNSALGPYNPPTNGGTSLGSIGTNQGMVLAGHSTHVGKVYVPDDSYTTGTPPTTVPNAPGACPDDFSWDGHASYTSVNQSNPTPVPTVYDPPDASTTNASSGTIVPGSYQNISVGSHGSLTLTAPGNYIVDCHLHGGVISNRSPFPARRTEGAITIYLTGTGCASSPLSMNSHSTINNASGVSANVAIIYNGTGTLSLQGGPQMCAVINAPNAAVAFGGGSDFFGTIMANSIDDHGGVNLHFDTADTTVPGVVASTATATATGSYNTLSFHSLSY